MEGFHQNIQEYLSLVSHVVQVHTVQMRCQEDVSNVLLEHSLRVGQHNVHSVGMENTKLREELGYVQIAEWENIRIIGAHWSVFLVKLEHSTLELANNIAQDVLLENMKAV